jgi:arginine decarboxylase
VRVSICSHGRSTAPLLRERLVRDVPELRVIEPDLLKSTPGVTGVDPTHVMIETVAIGMTGYRALDWLRAQRNIDVEPFDHRRIMPLITFARGEAEIDRLVRALRDLVDEHPDEDSSDIPGFPTRPQIRSESPMLPREAFFAKPESVKFKEAVGRISAELVRPYRPGFLPSRPVSSTAMKTSPTWRQFVEASGFVEGASDPTLQQLRVVAE